ncbi:tetratricopeptide (TPR) repeat protein [Novosphingobium hassiacum]|uniref:Tetratricopeptide (TPR) repeat protein n=1 Tax=Novosphingobium hassiacum TaxID=173676 RepID=A0A7W6EVJ1_9SPHN|nr:cellulose biosynthesis protein BcsC [Novosphingobium hassiacum]MBB3859985.1 tetratricopeptide (TPR) repeat protein [Novosphingobium hassiacum]
MSRSQTTIRCGLLAAMLAGAAVPSAVLATTPAVKALLDQAVYWRAKGRNDLADQALRRARAIDPTASVAAPARPKPVPVPVAKPVPKAVNAEPAPRKASTAPARPTATASAGTARVAGFSALESGDLGAAASRFERALAANRNDGDALGGLGIVRLRQNRFSDARDLLERASRLPGASRWADALASARFFGGLEDAREALEAGQNDKAQAIAEDTVRLGYPQQGPALELLAQIYEQQGRFADSADLYRQASAGGGSDEKRLASRAARGRALAAMARGDDYAAEQEFQGGLMIDRDDPWIRYEFARYMIGRGRRAEAESLVTSLAQSSDSDAVYAAALINKDLGNLLAASALVERVPESQRSPAMRNFAVSIKIESAIARAKALAQAGQKAGAISALRQIATQPSLAPARRAEVASALYDLGDESTAASIASSALDGEITDLGGYDALVRVLASSGREDLARAALQRASVLAGSSPDGQRTLARMSAGLAISQAERLRVSGQFAPAFDLLQGAWNSAPDNPEILSALARLYQSGGMSARAAQSWQLVLVRDARNRDALLGLAQTAQAAGDKEMSKDAADRALAAYPEDYQVSLTLARVAQDRGDKGTAVRLLKQARALYARQNGGSTAIEPGANPFTAAPGVSDGNPFRAQAYATPAPPPINPFALGNGTRLPTQSSASSMPQGFAPQTYATPGYAAAPLPPGATPTPSEWSGAPAGSFGMPAPAAVAGDPVLAAIASDIETLNEDARPRADLDTSYRSRKGETGLSALSEIKGTAEFSTGLAGGRVRARAEAVVIDSGRPTGSGLSRFGRNATIEAQAIVDKERAVPAQAQTQQDSGVAFTIGYADRNVQVEGGTTPVGMGKTQATFRASVTPELSPGVRAKAWAERKPVTDSIVSYAGTRDPVSGERWGQVMRTGGGAGFSYDRNGSGVYGEVAYNRYNGTNVRSNRGIEANVGGYLRLIKGARSQLTGGINANYQTYDNNQNYFTYGNGGYFSPQSFLSIGFPINYSLKSETLDIKANLTPGFQSFSQEESALYPTDPALQAELDALKALNGDVRARYDSLSRTGFAISAGGEIYYKVTSNTQVGGNISFTSFGQYEEFRSLIGIRQAIGGNR